MHLYLLYAVSRSTVVEWLYRAEYACRPKNTDRFDSIFYTSPFHHPINAFIVIRRNFILSSVVVPPPVEEKRCQCLCAVFTQIVLRS